jgi:hypothetical protein
MGRQKATEMAWASFCLSEAGPRLDRNPPGLAPGNTFFARLWRLGLDVLTARVTECDLPHADRAAEGFSDNLRRLIEDLLPKWCCLQQWLAAMLVQPS